MVSNIASDFSRWGEPNKVKAQKAMQEFIEACGLNVKEGNLAGTAERVATAYVEELFSGVHGEAPEIKAFPTPISTMGHTITIEAPVRSMCAHHFMPITGVAQILVAFLPDDAGNANLPGLSKYARVVDYWSRRPQLQERLTQQIGEYLTTYTDAAVVCVKVKATHHCMSHRGVQSHPEGVTTTVATYVKKQHPLIEELVKAFYPSGITCT